MKTVLSMVRSASICPLLLVAAACAGLAQAQPTEFPAGAQPMTAEALKALEGKTFAGVRADGRAQKMEFGPDAGFQVSYGPAGGFGGGLLDGKVRLDGNKVCQDMRKTTENSCNDVRVDGDKLFYKRNTNNEVITLTAQ